MHLLLKQWLDGIIPAKQGDVHSALRIAHRAIIIPQGGRENTCTPSRTLPNHYIMFPQKEQSNIQSNAWLHNKKRCAMICEVKGYGYEEK